MTIHRGYTTLSQFKQLNDSIANQIKPIASGRLMNVTYGRNVNYSLDYTILSEPYIIYIPLPRTLKSSQGDQSVCTRITINNPDKHAIEIRTEDWSSESPTAIISQYPWAIAPGDFSNLQTNLILGAPVSGSGILNLCLFDDGDSTKGWFLI